MSSALEAMVGQTLDGHYRLDKLLGAGGMGAVFRAHDVTTQRDVALKILHPDVGSDESISKRFDREAQSAAKLDHPNCVRVSAFGTAGGVKYLVMELLVGEELQAKLGAPWEPAAACAVLDQILAGLEHAHAHGIVHRDLKPENVFLTRDASGREVAKLVDFGIAKLLDADGAAEVLTRAGMVFGTPRYMSPEQAAGGKIDARSDLYSVGVLAYVLLSGHVPFESDDLAAVLRMHIMAPPPPLPASVPAPLAAWVESLLEKSRHERPESASVARERLAAVRTQLAAPTLPDAGSSTLPNVDQLGATGAFTAAHAVVDANAPLPSKPELMVGHVVAGRFSLRALIGVGGMGAVFRAEDSRTGTPVAVKVLHAAMADDEEIAARFEREAQTASELEHPHIVPVFSHGTTPGVGGDAHYLVMPLLDGVELRALIGEPPQPMEPGRACALMLQLLDALALAHGRGIVHRDLKPENVFVIRDEAGHEQVQLVDFGLAKVAEAGSSFKVLTRFGQVFGTAAYMSPEQCRGEVVDARTDIYAVGIMLYELLAGRPPFVAETPVVLLGMQVFDEPPPLPEHISPALRQAVANMLIKPREQRTQTAAAAIEQLRSALARPELRAVSAPTLAPVTVPGPTPPSNPLQMIPRKWLYVGGGVLGLLVLVALWPGGGSSESSETSGTTADGQTETDGQAAPPAAAGTPSPTGILDVVTNAAGPGEQVYLEIDRLLTAKDGDAALTRVKAERDRFADDGGLMWREGRALALVGGETNRVTALHRFAEAVTADPSLNGNTEFEAELRSLLRDPKLRDVALDVSVRKLGDLGHGFLVEALNDDTRVLGYVDRHRALDELGNAPTMLARVDLPRQRRLDLQQAHTAPNACTAFADALDRTAKDGDAGDLPVLDDRKLEIPVEPGVTDPANACDGLADKHAAVRAQLAETYPEAAAQSSKAASKKSGKKKKFFPF